ncbi:hypothetical protein RDI58_013390 [Solanum bulbocastanum]|uniref:Uncharacterized protein n=1 Tax=Solanum bulbocastanum TaxID=147425 RepID=A0AAN8TKT2_SOLBU
MLLAEEVSAVLSDEDAANLIRLLIASPRKADLEKIVPASDNKKKYHTKAQKDGDAEYSLLVNLKRLDDDLDLSRQISIEILHNDLAESAPKAKLEWKKVEDLWLRLQVQAPHHAKRIPVFKWRRVEGRAHYPPSLEGYDRSKGRVSG